MWGGHVPRSIETQFSTIWALTDFTESNGATRVVPGSHLWEDDREPQPHEITYAGMEAASVLVYSASVLHGGGRNDSERLRRAKGQNSSHPSPCSGTSYHTDPAS